MEEIPLFHCRLSEQLKEIIAYPATCNIQIIPPVDVDRHREGSPMDGGSVEAKLSTLGEFSIEVMIISRQSYVW